MPSQKSPVPVATQINRPHPCGPPRSQTLSAQIWRSGRSMRDSIERTQIPEGHTDLERKRTQKRRDLNWCGNRARGGSTPH